MALLGCLPRIPIVLCNLMRAIGIGVRDEPSVLELEQDEPLVLELQQDDVVNDLPDDCLIDVLTRLASYDILRCRRVCKKWYILTSSDLFIESQTKRAPTIILGSVSGLGLDDTRKYFTLDDKKFNVKLKELQLNKIGTNFSKNGAKLLYSFGGLLVFMGRYGIFIVLNSISRKEAIIQIPKDNDGNYFRGEVCGLFFHPLGGEYNLLFVHVGADNNSCWYYVYGSASNSWRNINTIPLHFRPPYRCAPVFVDMGLHWIVDFGGTGATRHGVMVFKIDSEEICTFPLHELVGSDICDSSPMTLFEIDKRLCFAHQITHNRTIDIWIVDDYKNWRWTKMRTLHFSSPIITGPSRSNFHSGYISRNRLKILYVCPGMLLISWKVSEPYLIDLAHDTMHRMYDPHICSDIEGLYIFATYTCSLKIPNV